MTGTLHRLEESELILREGGRVYHLDLAGDDIADDVILVGDPGRVAEVSGFFSKIEKRFAHREFITHTGVYNENKLTVISTGIGTDNIDIVLNELDAAVNIDPVKRIPREKKRKLRLYRLGTSGSLQEDICVNELVVSSHGLGLDSLMNYYESRSVSEPRISEAFMKHCSWHSSLPFPMCFAADQELLGKFEVGGIVRKGITATAPGFYAPQGRRLRLEPFVKELNEQLSSFRFDGMRISNFEMETSALYGLGKMLGHQCLTVCVIIANRKRKEFCEDYSASVRALIEKSLDIITT